MSAALTQGLRKSPGYGTSNVSSPLWSPDLPGEQSGWGAGELSCGAELKAADSLRGKGDLLGALEWSSWSWSLWAVLDFLSPCP